MVHKGGASTIEINDASMLSLLAAEKRLHLLCHGIVCCTEAHGQGFMTLARIVEGLRPMSRGLECC